jgi:hypothetical protein
VLPRAPRRDPVWDLLARMAGRSPGDPPGTGFRAPRAWRVPADWVEPLPRSDRPWLYAVAGGRLWVRHPHGFTAIDVPAGPDPAARLRRELARHRLPPAAIVPEPDTVLAARRYRAGDLATSAYSRWIARTAEYVGVRLRFALGTRSSAAAARMLLCRPATIVVDSDRVDARFWLDDLPIAIRAAGLDRDPGWIPATGRVVAFHFA